MNQCIYKNFFIASLVLLTISQLAGKNPNEIEVRPTGEELIETEPKAVVTTAFRVTNLSSPEQEFVAEIDLPEGWKLITREFPFSLSPNQTEIKLVSFHIPTYALAGRYTLTYRVHSRDNPSLSDLYTFTVVVLTVRKLEIQVINKTDYAIAGEKYSILYQVKNWSNQSESFRIVISNHDDLKLFIERYEYTLKPGESIQIPVNIQSDKDIKKQIKQAIFAELISKTTEDIMTRVSTKVIIIPRKIKRSLPYRYFPLQTSVRTFRTFNMEDKYGFQLDIKGEGTLDEKGEKNLEFHVRGPSAYGKSVLGNYDEYNVHYYTDTYSIKLGDSRYSLSQLTENSRYGRGVQGIMNLSKFKFGAYYEKSRWMFGPTREIAGFVDYYLNKDNYVGINYLNKKKDDQLNDIYSVEGNFNILKDTDIQLEGSVSNKNGKNEYAQLFNLSGLEKGFSYSMRYIYATRNFPGYYRDTKYITANVNVPIFSNLRVSGRIQDQKRNFDLDTTRYSAPYTKQYDFGLNYNLKSHLRFSLMMRQRSSEDRLPAHLFDYEENGYVFQLDSRLKYVGFSFYTNWGETYNNITQKSAEMVRYRFSSSLYLNKWQRYSFYAMYDESSIYRIGNSKRWTLGMDCNIHFSDKFYFSLRYKTNSSTEEYYTNRDLLEGYLRYRLPNDHRISLQCRQTLLKNSIDKKETAFLLNYQAPFNVPIGLKKYVGSVSGQVYNMETSEPLKDIIIRLNNFSVVTDKNGKFIFPALNPGKYLLSVDKASIGLDKITVPNTPISLEVQPKEEKQLTIDIVKGAILSGQINIYKYVGADDSSYKKQTFIEEQHGTTRKFYLVGEGGNGR
ncbi:MAG: carboxypeptidase-like regulatory domain-containing protein, partial [bacterium]